jgi:hypothetical protein
MHPDVPTAGVLENPYMYSDYRRTDGQEVR